MGASRACRPCRTAKTKCDLKRPTCSFCSKRKIVCGGYASDSEYLFRDQNTTAKVNSERSRRGSRHATDKLCFYVTNTKNDSGCVDYDSPQASTLRIANPVLYKLEDRVLDMFYMEWVSRAYAERKTPGYLDLLPEMKEKAPPISALNLAVEAFALANARNFMSCHGNLKQMAFSRYGAALATVRNAIMQGALTADDATLMAIMTIDMFEVVFMVREEPLKLHNNAIEYLLAVRGTEQIQSNIGCALYRMANHRLQVRQLGLGLGPLPVQLACIDLLDLSTPRYSLSKIQLGAQQTLAMSRDLNSFNREELSLLIFQIQVNLDEFEQWKICLPESWMPKRVQLSDHRDIFEALIARALPFTPEVLIYEDPFIAHQMAFFYHGQLALRSRLLDTFAATNEMFPNQASFELEIDAQETAISSIADILIESAAPLLGSIEFDDAGSVCLTGKKINICFTRGICWALQQEKRVSAEHKAFTYRVEDWIRQEADIHRQF